MKKNRRGLGRGLEALIQSTVPDNEDAASHVEKGEPFSTRDETPRHSEASLQNEDGEWEKSPGLEMTEDSPEKMPEQLDTATDGSLTSLTAEATDEAARRYLPRDESSTVGHVSQETRRPVDVFFPDRLTAPSQDTAQRGSAPQTTQTNGRQRPTMPAVTTAASLRTSTATPSSARRTTRQPESADQHLSGSLAASAPDDRVDGESAERQHADLAGTAELRSIPVGDIHPNPRQPREVFDEVDMDELVASITEVGVLQPIVVRPVQGTTPYELVMGERRWRASQRAGMAAIPAIVRHTSDTDLLRDALLENLHRSQLNPLEEAAAYEQLLDDFECTQDELSARIGRSRPQISNTLRLLRLPPMVQRRVASGVLSAGHARALLGLADPGEMEKLAQKVVSEGLSVRSTEELVSLHDGIRQTKPKPRSPRSDRHERIDYLASSLTDQLDTTVKITLGARKGKIAIDFASVEDLNRIMALIQPPKAEEGHP